MIETVMTYEQWKEIERRKKCLRRIRTAKRIFFILSEWKINLMGIGLIILGIGMMRTIPNSDVWAAGFVVVLLGLIPALFGRKMELI